MKEGKDKRGEKGEDERGEKVKGRKRGLDLLMNEQGWCSLVLLE